VPLSSLQVDSLRCIERARIEPAPRLTVIHGANGSGKTSLLEAMFIVGRGRSFRTRNTERLIRRGADRLQLFAETQEPAHRIGFGYDTSGQPEARLDGRTPATLAELPTAFFVEVIDPDIHRLIEGAPAERRRWLDWGVFHVEPTFLSRWTRYARALRQRNAALRAGQDPSPWDRELAEQGEALHAQRAAWFETLRPQWERTVQALVDVPLEMTLRSGWTAGMALADALAAGRERDRARGATGSGPHRADIVLRAPGRQEEASGIDEDEGTAGREARSGTAARSARDILSRGQQKLAAAAMVLALLGRLREDDRQPAPTLLLDDPAAELDVGRLEAFVAAVRSLDCQIVLTSLAPDARLFGTPERVFHVEQGRVQEVY